MRKPNYALITGASSGIGLELARICAQDGYNLVLIARSKERLEALKTELGKTTNVEIEIIVTDLAKPQAATKLYQQVQERNLHISLLVNNAGFGNFGPYAETDWQVEAEMIQVNVVALCELTKLILPDMLKQKSGKILNVASTAAFFPGPLMAVYFASKAFVLSFTEALANELEGSGVQITALCPGPTQTGFQKRAFQEDSGLFKGKLPSAAEVAAFGYEALNNGQLIAVHGIKNKFSTFIARFFPVKWVAASVRRSQE